MLSEVKRFEFLATFSLTALSLGLPTQKFQSATQPATLTVTVFDSLSRNPLPNADVTDLSSGQSRITDENGRAYLQLPSGGKLQLRVRQIGYQPRRLDFTALPPGNTVNVAFCVRSRNRPINGPLLD